MTMGSKGRRLDLSMKSFDAMISRRHLALKGWLRDYGEWKGCLKAARSRKRGQGRRGCAMLKAGVGAESRHDVMK